MTKTIDDMILELNEWLDQPAFSNILNENRKEELRIVMHKYFTDKANDLDYLDQETKTMIIEFLTLKKENVDLRSAYDEMNEKREQAQAQIHFLQEEIISVEDESDYYKYLYKNKLKQYKKLKAKLDSI